MVDVFFADDARQRRPTRPGMGELVAAGGLYVPAASVNHLEARLESICNEFEFPLGEEFKWSPSRDAWMHGNLTGEHREEFFRSVLKSCSEVGAEGIVCVNDTTAKTATDAASHEQDVTTLLLERVDWASTSGNGALVIVDRPGGGRRDEDRFLADCMETVKTGTRFRKFRGVVLTPFTGNSVHCRLLQAADLVTSCSAAALGGDTKWAAPLLPSISALLRRGLTGEIGGHGLKMHPDYKYANLYHWLLGDTIFWRNNLGVPLPLPDRRYAQQPEGTVISSGDR